MENGLNKKLSSATVFSLLLLIMGVLPIIFTINDLLSGRPLRLTVLLTSIFFIICAFVLNNKSRSNVQVVDDTALKISKPHMYFIPFFFLFFSLDTLRAIFFGMPPSFSSFSLQALIDSPSAIFTSIICVMFMVSSVGLYNMKRWALYIFTFASIFTIIQINFTLAEQGACSDFVCIICSLFRFLQIGIFLSLIYVWFKRKQFV